MTGRLVLFAGLLGATGAGAAAAQADSSARDTTRRAPADTTAPDSGNVLRPRFPPAHPAGPLPGGTRYSFPADSLRLSGSATLSDVLLRIPGVYVARGGFYGQPEPIMLAGRGAVALEIFWDGVPHLPLGRDSIFLDPARIPLAPLERIDVVVSPSGLRVYLVTASRASTEPVTEVAVLTGQQLDLARYFGSFARRWRSGLSLSLMADLMSHDGTGDGSSTGFDVVDLWLKTEFVPSERVGVSYQLVSTDWTRDERTGVVQGWTSHRQEHVVRAFVARRPDGFGPRAELLLSTANVAEDSGVGRRSGWQHGLALRQTWRRAQAGVQAWVADDRRPFELEAAASWLPLRRMTLAAEARTGTYAGSRSGQRVRAGAGLELPLGFSAQGDVVWTRGPAAPFVPGDTIQETTDLGGSLRWQNRWARLEVGSGRHDPFAPVGAPAGLAPITALAPSLATRYVSVSGSIAPPPLGGLALSGWYFNPAEPEAADFEPPHHGRVSATFQSKFWRVFRSGIFTLRGEVGLESWSRGRGGLGAGAAALELPGATFIDGNIEMQIGGATIHWTIRNGRASDQGYVPGLAYPSAVQYFGVKWTFGG